MVLLRECAKQINKLIGIWHVIKGQEHLDGSINEIKQAYIKKIQEKKNVINFLNVRDD